MNGESDIFGEFPIKLLVLPATFRGSEHQAGKGNFSEPCIVSRASLTVEICQLKVVLRSEGHRYEDMLGKWWHLSQRLELKE